MKRGVASGVGCWCAGKWLVGRARRETESRCIVELVAIHFYVNILHGLWIHLSNP